MLEHNPSIAMPQSLSRVYLHLVFSTKHRERIIKPHLRENLHEYMGGILKSLGCGPVEINSEPDHAHLLFTLSRTTTIARLVGETKRGSTIWIREKFSGFESFSWQNGYGAFSVSESGLSAVRTYIRNQEEHHKKYSFKEEFRKLCAAYRIEWDERYVWD